MYICNTCAGFRNIVLVLWQLEQWMESLQKHIFAQRIKTGTSQDLLRINQHSCAVLYSRLEVITVVNKIQYEVGFLLTSFPFQLAKSQRKGNSPAPKRWSSCWRHWRCRTEIRCLRSWTIRVIIHEDMKVNSSCLFIFTSAHISSFPLKSPWSFIKWVWIKNYCPRKHQDGWTRIDQVYLPGCELLDGQLRTWVGALWVAAARQARQSGGARQFQQWGKAVMMMNSCRDIIRYSW